MVISDFRGNTADIKSLVIPLFYKRFFWSEFAYEKIFEGVISREDMNNSFSLFTLESEQFRPLLKTNIIAYENMLDPCDSELLEVSFFVNEAKYPEKPYENVILIFEFLKFEFLKIKEIKRSSFG